MHKLNFYTTFVWLLGSLLLIYNDNAKGDGAEVYRCKDAHGIKRYGDAMPEECKGQDTEVLGSNGLVQRVILGVDSLATQAARKASDAAAQKQKEEAEFRDRMLLDTYLSVQDIENLREQRVGLLKTQIHITEQGIETLRERETRLKQQIQRFRPYSTKSDAVALPDHIAEEMVNTFNGITVSQQTLAEKHAELDDIETQFISDVRRFKELKGLK